MDWKTLLSTRRLGRDKADEICPGRSPFQQDFDRITFAASFRKLQDKTQVFPLSRTPYVRTRLTHSLESASVGRSLGLAAGAFLCKEFDLAPIQAPDVGAIVAAAALAHDIGNPPLGHAGEEAIRHWFNHSPVGLELREKLLPGEVADIDLYEGNAQGFRVLSVLEMADQRGGMRLTSGTLGAFLKYPRLSLVEKLPPGVAGKKFNIFFSERELFREVAADTGMQAVATDSYRRHPLAFLVEAADDITYRIIDFEDGVMLGVIQYVELEDAFLRIIQSDWARDYLRKLSDPMRRVQFLRARAIGKLIEEISEAFVIHHDDLLAGTLEKPLIEYIPAAQALTYIQRRSAEDVYTHPLAAEIIAAGFEIFSGLLDIFVPAVNERAAELNGGLRASYRSRRLLDLLPAEHRPEQLELWRQNAYTRLQGVLDYVTGMTDSNAVALYKKLKGISIG